MVLYRLPVENSMTKSSSSALLTDICFQDVPCRLCLWAITDEVFIVNFALEGVDESGCPDITKYKSVPRGYGRKGKGLHLNLFLNIILECNNSLYIVK